MDHPANLLLLADDPDRLDDLAQRLRQAGATPVPFSEANEALATLSEGSWPTVVVSTARCDAPGLCEAIRQLQPTARILIICDAADEPEMRDMLGLAVDEYFINPPSADDIDTIAHWAGLSRPVETGLHLAAQTVGELIDSTRSLPALEQFLAQKSEELIGAKVSWVHSVPKGAQPLLTLEGRSTLHLLAEQDARIPPTAQEFLQAIRVCLPAVVAAVQRTETLHRLAITDHLTGAYNRRYFYHATDRILRESEGKDARVTLLLFDIDDFKRYNDTHGHATGDMILQEVAELMRKITRTQDIVARIGGDEFAVLFWDEDPPRVADSAPPESAHQLATRFCHAMKNHSFSALGIRGAGRLTISGGLATFPTHGRTCQELLRKADVALREVKRTGKNAICLVGRTGEFVSDDTVARELARSDEPPATAR